MMKKEEIGKSGAYDYTTKNIINLSSNLNGGYWGNIHYQRRKTPQLLTQNEWSIDDNNDDSNVNTKKRSPSFMSPVVTPGNPFL